MGLGCGCGYGYEIEGEVIDIGNGIFFVLKVMYWEVEGMWGGNEVSDFVVNGEVFDVDRKMEDIDMFCRVFRVFGFLFELLCLDWRIGRENVRSVREGRRWGLFIFIVFFCSFMKFFRRIIYW